MLNSASVNITRCFFYTIVNRCFVNISDFYNIDTTFSRSSLNNGLHFVVGDSQGFIFKRSTASLDAFLNWPFVNIDSLLALRPKEASFD